MGCCLLVCGSCSSETNYTELEQNSFRQDFWGPAVALHTWHIVYELVWDKHTWAFMVYGIFPPSAVACLPEGSLVPRPQTHTREKGVWWQCDMLPNLWEMWPWWCNQALKINLMMHRREVRKEYLFFCTADVKHSSSHSYWTVRWSHPPYWGKQHYQLSPGYGTSLIFHI